jgi:hypothetical protein
MRFAGWSPRDLRKGLVLAAHHTPENVLARGKAVMCLSSREVFRDSFESKIHRRAEEALKSD